MAARPLCRSLIAVDTKILCQAVGGTLMRIKRKWSLSLELFSKAVDRWKNHSRGKHPDTQAASIGRGEHAPRGGRGVLANRTRDDSHNWLLPCAPTSAETTPPADVKPALAELGKRTFDGVGPSGVTGVSRAFCHDSAEAFSECEPFSAAYPGVGHFRNTTTPAKLGYHAAWMRYGRLRTNLNDIAREVITETYLMHMDMRALHV